MILYTVYAITNGVDEEEQVISPISGSAQFADDARGAAILHLSRFGEWRRAKLLAVRVTWPETEELKDLKPTEDLAELLKKTENLMNVTTERTVVFEGDEIQPLLAAIRATEMKLHDFHFRVVLFDQQYVDFPISAKSKRDAAFTAFVSYVNVKRSAAVAAIHVREGNSEYTVFETKELAEEMSKRLEGDKLKLV